MMFRDNEKFRFSRRSLLASAGLAGIFAPMLNASKGWAAPVFPRRLIIMQWTNGCIADSFFPKGGGTSFTLPECTAPLEPHRNEMIFLSGLGLRAQTDSKIQGAGVGHQSLPFLLTGSNGAQGRNDAGACAIASSLSIDQYVANALVAHGMVTKFKSLELGAYNRSGKDNERSISYRGAPVGGRPADNPPDTSPYSVWARIFKDLPTVPAGGQPGMDEEFLKKVRSQRKSVLDFVGTEITNLRKRMGSDDAQKLDEHLDQLRQLEDELTNLNSGATCAATQPAAGVDVKAGNQIDKQITLQIDLMVAAMKCDLTRVATMMMCNSANDGVAFPFLGSDFASVTKYLDGDHHGIAHGGGRKKIIVDTWWMKQLASVIDKLKKTPEGSGTMLDNTVILLANHMDNGGAHGTAAGVPFMLAGACGGYFKTGRYVNGHSASTPHNQVLVALANAMLDGVQAPLASFGDPRYGGELPHIRS